MDYNYKHIDLESKHAYHKARLLKLFNRIKELRQERGDAFADLFIKELAKNDFRFFVYYFCSEWFYGKAGYLHDYLFDFIDEVNKKTVCDDNGIVSRAYTTPHNIIAPRGNAKTSIALNCWTCWDILYKREKNIVLVADTTSRGED